MFDYLAIVDGFEHELLATSEVQNALAADARHWQAELDRMFECLRGMYRASHGETWAVEACDCTAAIMARQQPMKQRLLAIMNVLRPLQSLFRAAN